MTLCEFPKDNASNEQIDTILKEAKTIAIVGISNDEEKASYRVAEYLKEHGYTIIPVNPKYKEILGLTCYPSLKEVPCHIDIVDIFRACEAIPAIVDEAIEIKAGTVWMQLGLANNEYADKARNAGLSVVMNKCTKIEHDRLK